MKKREEGMPVTHPRPCIPHDLSYLLPHTVPVAMYHAVRAGGLFFLERALSETLSRVFLNFRAGRAKISRCFVKVLAEDAYHRADRPVLTGNPPGHGMFILSFIHLLLLFL